MSLKGPSKEIFPNIDFVSLSIAKKGKHFKYSIKSIINLGKVSKPSLLNLNRILIPKISNLSIIIDKGSFII